MICASPDFLALALLAIGAVARPLAPKPSDVSVTLDGKTYINKGLVAFGLIPNNAIESTGDTIGGIGSAIALSSFGSLGNGSFSGTLIVQPDRGYNVESTIDYQGRQLAIDFLLTPYTESAELSFQNALSTLRLTYKSTLLYTDRDNIATTGLDAQGVRPAEEGFPSATRPDANPPVPIPSSTNNRLSLDLEGIVLNEDGSFWISDEYGPYIYRYSLQGDIIQTIQPPEAILPLDAKGELDFTSVTDPVTGRSANQGFEGLTISGDKKTLYALLQSGTVQDGESQYTRLLAFDVSDPAVRPTPTGEWVVPLPTSKKGKVRAASEVHFVSENIFLALSRDGHGRGGGTDEDDLDSSYKQADLFSITKATNILGKYDNPANPVAPDGVLLSSVTPATYVSFVDYVDDTQLARFGLHNGEPDDQTLLNAKWESLALASAMDPDYPEDYFLFTASDNDFLSENGIFDGQAFDAGENVDNQFLVFRVTLPGATIGDLA